MSGVVGLPRAGSLSRLGHKPDLFPRSRVAERHRISCHNQECNHPAIFLFQVFPGVINIRWANRPNPLRAFAQSCSVRRRECRRGTQECVRYIGTQSALTPI
jgi:hypothetical protein